MSQAELHTPPSPARERSLGHGREHARELAGEELISGWGRTAPTRARVMRALSAEQVADVLGSSSAGDGGVIAGGVIARGAGRSYGDAAQNGDGTVLDMTSLRGDLALDGEGGTVRAGAGRTFAEVLLFLARHGRTLPVVPGTRHLTVGGAIASDVHGKNHVRDGSLGRHLESFTLCTPADGPLRVSEESDPELFRGTLGGMGLTGVVVEATLTTSPMQESHAVADIDRTDTLAEALGLMAQESGHRYSIAWVDLLSDGRAFGRGIVTRSDNGTAARAGELRAGGLPGSRDGPVGAPFRVRARLSVPSGFPRGVLRPATVKAFNAIHWRSTPRRERERRLSMSGHLFPLDVLGDWNRLYGPGGLTQYQFAVPSNARDTLIEVVERLRRRRLPMYLAVVKRFGGGSEGFLSFPIEGWTLAIDMPADAPGLSEGLREADELIAGAGGRVYLAKDSRLAGETLRAMYPSVERFLQLRARVDPRQVLRSDMARRLELWG